MIVKAMTLSAIVILAASPPAEALRFGADSLPYLERHAAYVVVAGGVRAEPAAEGARVSLYTLAWTAALKGDPEGAELRIALPKHLDLAGPEELEGAWIFLRPAMNEEDCAHWGIVCSGAVHEVVAGRFGVLSPTLGDKVFRAVASYLEAPAPEDKMDWAEEHLGSSEPFLSRSALLEATAPEQSLANERVQRLLERSLTIKTLTLDLRRLGLQLFRNCESPRSLEVLRSLAEDTGENLRLRLDAIEAISPSADGLDLLRAWEKVEDRLLKSKAVERLKELKIEMENRIENNHE
jgi:hypothetical protein